MWKVSLLVLTCASIAVIVATDEVSESRSESGDVAEYPTGDYGDTKDTNESSETDCSDGTGETVLPRCPRDQIYTDFKDRGCYPLRCSELGFPGDLTQTCEPGCACRNSTYVISDNGICIPRDQCPYCGDDANAVSGCGNNCGKTCATYKKKPVACPLFCIINGCDCRDGYVYDSNLKKCVNPRDCTPTCGQNEVFIECTNGGCDARNCSQVGKPVPCVKIDPKYCIKGCVCKPGLLRSANGSCVYKNQCNEAPKCGQNEVFINCINGGCDARNCSQVGKPVPCVKIDPKYCIKGCVCKPGLLRSANGSCVHKNQCNEAPKCGQNEVFINCINGGCDARNCSQVGKPVPCVKIDPKNCIKGCVCKPGLLRSANGSCVHENQCNEAKCTGKNEYYENCISGCTNQSCNDIGKVFHCPIQPAVCRSGCRCNKGFYRDPNNNECVAESECPLKCGKNEVSSDCSNGGCGPFSCSDIGKPVKCVRPAQCVKGCVCQNTYVRHENGTCVPKDQCPGPCGNDPNSKPGCGVNCGKTCSTYKSKAPICPRICKVNGCDCKDKFVFDPNVNKCVPPSKCTPTCGLDEVYDSCANGGCNRRNCSQLSKPRICIDPIKCIGGCVCQPNKLRDVYGKCIPQDKCPIPKCGKNEVFNFCLKPCPPRKCGVNPSLIRCAAPPEPGSPDCEAGCECADGYLRNSTGTCVLKSECEKPKQCPANEVFNPCLKTCPGQRCGVDPALILCAPNPKPGDPACKSGCECVDGYVRNATDVCVPKNQCPLKCGKNEISSDCSNGGCGPFSCSDLGKPVKCVRPAQCVKGCVCQNTYVRHENGTCVPKDQCPAPTCGLDEVYDSCANGGCNRRNCSQLSKPRICIDPIKCIGGCVCQPNYLRDVYGKCVPQDKCHATKCTGQNEYYERCISGCSNQTCNDIGKSYNCPAQLGCKSGCRCNPGFWRDMNNTCISESLCPTPPCPEGETYSRCPTVKCEGDYCPKNKDSPTRCPVGIVCDKPRCVCGFNRRRDWKTGKCILNSECPPYPCGKHEVFKTCPANCPGEKCSDYINSTKCPRYRIGIVVPCEPQCKCKEGYYRDSNDTCVLAALCGPKSTTTSSPPVIIHPPHYGTTTTTTGQEISTDDGIENS